MGGVRDDVMCVMSVFWAVGWARQRQGLCSVAEPLSQSVRHGSARSGSPHPTPPQRTAAQRSITAAFMRLSLLPLLSSPPGSGGAQPP